MGPQVAALQLGLVGAWGHRGALGWAPGCGAVWGVCRGQPYPQVVLLLFSLYPVEGLLLRVDAEGEAAGPGGEDAVLNRELVGGQPLGAPPGRGSDRGNGDFSGRAASRRGASEAGELGGQSSLPSLCRWVSCMPPGLCAPSPSPGSSSPADLNVVREQVLESEGLAQGDPPLQDVTLPDPVDHLVPEVPREGTLIAQEGCAQQAVAQQLHAPVHQLVQIVQPPGVGGGCREQSHSGTTRRNLLEEPA